MNDRRRRPVVHGGRVYVSVVVTLHLFLS
jgi:hypothetical protein